MPDNPHRIPLRYDPKGKAFGRRPEELTDLSIAIDVIRKQISEVRGAPLSSWEWGAFEAAGKCQPESIITATGIIERATDAVKTTMASVGDDPKNWDDLYQNFRDAIGDECQCEHRP